MSRKVLAVVCGLVSVAALAAALWLALGSIGGPVPMSQQEERAAVGGTGPLQVCDTTPVACPGPCTPPTLCVPVGGVCTGVGGVSGCGTAWALTWKFRCKWAAWIWCDDDAFPNWCGPPGVPACPLMVGGTCPAGVCVPGPVGWCGSC
jgi:hypothetical protein